MTTNAAMSPKSQSANKRSSWPPPPSPLTSASFYLNRSKAPSELGSWSSTASVNTGPPTPRLRVPSLDDQMKINNLWRGIPNSEYYKPRPRNRITRYIREDFADETTIHAFKFFAGTDRSTPVRIVWFLLFAGSLTLCTIVLKPQAEAHLRGDTRTMYTTRKSDKQAVFPSITICNNNMLRRSVVGRSPNLYLPIAKEMGISEEQAHLLCKDDSANELLAAYLSDFELLTKTIDMFLLPLGAMDSYQSLVSCKFGWKNISCDDLPFINKMTDGGFCFTFNPRGDYRLDNITNFNIKQNAGYPPLTGNLLGAYASGPDSGLELILNAQQFDYCDAGGTGRAGFRMIIHNPQVDAMFRLDNSINLSPGTDTVVSVKIADEVRETKHLGRCVERVENLTFAIKGSEYFQGVCFNECFMQYIWDNCKCYPYYAPPNAVRAKARTTGIPVNEVLCINPKQSTCSVVYRNEFYEKVMLETRCAYCAEPCNKMTYITQVSTQQFPAENAAPMFFDNKYPKISPKFLQVLEKVNMSSMYLLANQRQGRFKSVQEVRENLLSLRVYIDSLNFDVSIEQEEFPLTDLISNIGGTLGLFLGASVLSFFEIFHCCIAVCYYCGRKNG